MSEAAIIALTQFAIKFGFDAAIAWAKAFKGATIDDAIAALETAKTKTAADYIAEDKVVGGG